MGNYFTVKLNDNKEHIIYGEDKDLEAMVKENIIKEYTHALENQNIGRIYDNYIQTELENKVNDICYHIQNVKRIDNGDCPPDLNIKMDEAIECMKDVINEIIMYQEEIQNENDKK